MTNVLFIIGVCEKLFSGRFCCLGLKLKIPYRRHFHNFLPNDCILQTCTCDLSSVKLHIPNFQGPLITGMKAQVIKNVTLSIY